MKVAIVGGGFTGLSAAYELTKYGHKVTLFEKEKTLGGLAQGFKEKQWDWYLEGGYHHLFTNDHAILTLAKELKVPIITKRPITATYWKNHIYQLDSPYSLLTFPGLPIVDRLRTGMLLAALKLNPFWRPLEWVTAEDVIKNLGGNTAWEVLWEPLMIGKFGTLADTVPGSWFWARIKKRTPKLCYIEGGFHTLVEALTEAVKNNGSHIYTDTTVSSIVKVSRDQYLVFRNNTKETFDRVLLTIPTPIAFKIFPQLLNTSTQPLLTIPHLHAQTLILETKEPILKNVYWLNITDRTFPFLAAVAHTNFMDKSHYAGHHLTYFGNYLPEVHPYLSMTKEQLLKEFKPFIKRLNPSCQLSAVSCQLFVGPFAQPVHQLHYSRLAPKLKTRVPGIYVANLDSIYPWDRGTNYAVELGQKAAHEIIK